MHNQVSRKYIVGSEWLCYKIYLSESTADNLLANSIYKTLKKLIKDNEIDSFFFIRYNDPEFHIRLRIKLKNVEKLGFIISVFHNLFNKYVLDERINSIQIDTYQREIERYGDFTMELSEQFFFYDSLNVLQILSSIDLSTNSDSRWLHAALLINHYLDLFDFDLYERIDFLKNLKSNFNNEYYISSKDSKEIANRYKNKRKLLADLLNSDDAHYNKLFTLHQRDSSSQSFVIKSLISNFAHNSPFIPANRLITSFFHMSLNRIFIKDNSVSEYILYDFMHRYFLEESYKEK
ncbi:hypothetical protein AY601_4424 [Pedobacter cryoconitis]|uniref:Thiopeptide-type bacteriocin biosynthesis domain-containing protein n=1 Tax=Pedobacter cryoconitis TaxID=188932 RepID=A0A127VIW6_9SPHI|nr:thiopeptide-type bacteriocin biosynthesis protein [Pedobacter cryoconitis]AMQ01265.1 hypothetical protein AY601_4424 [Pedobacter cryoconitis]